MNAEKMPDAVNDFIAKGLAANRAHDERTRLESARRHFCEGLTVEFMETHRGVDFMPRIYAFEEEK